MAGGASQSLQADPKHQLYGEAAAAFGTAIERLARAYEADPDRRRDLVQEIHVALWQSFDGFDGRCSLRTWVYRVAHNVAISQVIRRRSKLPTLVGLDELDQTVVAEDHEAIVDRKHALERLLSIIHKLNPRDRQIILLYLDGMDAASIADIAGVSPGNVATKVHRIKAILSSHFKKGGRDDD